MSGELEARVKQASWYHSIELPGGIVTPGEYDLRESPRKVGFPGSLEGMRCLDVGTRDGFWAFEMEKRGAAEVIALDIDDESQLDWPLPHPILPPTTVENLDARLRTFDIAHDALNSKVDRRNFSVYDLSPETMGEFDFAFIGTLLHHLRDPIGALMAIRSVLKGDLLIAAVISWSLTIERPRTPVAELMGEVEPFWWIPNRAALRRSVRAAGYEIVKSGGPFMEPIGAGGSKPAVPVKLGQLRLIPRRLALRAGATHVWIRARPR
jgi:tRNA (mo5U34)-methyltransferase